VNLIQNRLVSSVRVSLLTLILFTVPHGTVNAQSATRPVQLTLWECCGSGAIPTSAEVDIRALGSGLSGPSILLGQHADVTLNGRSGIDWSQIAAVEYDEPYNSSGIDGYLGDDCTPPPASAFQPVDSDLAARAAELKILNPNARFWVNFNSVEASWMAFCATPQVFNRTYIDVISEDYYNADFALVQPFYDVVALYRATPHQQFALVPGVFSAPQSQLGALQEYFDYANSANQSCNLPLGPQGITGIYDGCPVWVVMGWLTLNYSPYVGILVEPASQAILNVWQAEAALTPMTTTQLARASLLPATLRVILP
jgi:hypothetical protein